MENMEYLGFEVGHQTWKPSMKKVEALQKAKITNLKSLQSFLGACNFYRRHVPNFTFSSAILTDLTKKDRKWEWTPMHENAFQELKDKPANVKGLGIPPPNGEIVMVTDASNVGGGASIYQWQKLQCPENGEISEGMTQGVNRDGTIKHTHGPCEQLIPLGHYNWKWNPARANYSTYQQELLSGILTLASQIRILGHLPIVWLCDQEATMTFPKSPPPNLPRLRRWWLILTQFRLNIFHIPGAKNELCDYLSRNNFCEKFQVDFEELAKQAFQKMDTHLDLRMEILNDMILDYPNDPKLGTIWSQLTPGRSKIIDKDMFWRNESKLFVEKKIAFHMKMYQNAFYGYIPHLDIQVPIGHFGISINIFFRTWDQKIS